MFKLFRRRRDKPSVMYGVFQKMGNAVETRQRRAADYLNAKAERLSKRQLVIGLICFVTLFGGSAAAVIWQAFHRPVATVRVKSIVIPDHVLIPEQESPKERALTGTEIRHIRSFRRYLDSLQQSGNGKAMYDSIARHRPGLLDSLSFIEEVYNEQLKTSEDGKKK